MKKALVLITVLIFQTFALGEPASHTGGLPATNLTGPATAFSLEELGKFKGEAIEQDAYAEKAWNYLAPNEHYNHLFENCLPKEGGAYISVGTFRGMNVASSGKVSHLVMMDIDSSAVIFNRINLQLVAKAKDRFQYLSYLFTGQENPDLEKKAKSGELKPTEFIRELLRKKAPSEKLFEDWKTGLGVTLADGEWERFKTNLKGDNASYTIGADGLMRNMQIEFDAFNTVGTFDKTIMGNDDRFTKIQEMISNKKVTVIAGSLAGDKSMKSLNELLRKDGLKVAAVDTSNVPDYLTDAQRQKTIENIRALPMRETGRMLYTGASDISAPRDGWGYYAMNQKHLEGLATFHYRESGYTSAGGQKHLMKLDPGNIKDAKMFYSSDDLPCN